MSLTHRYLPIMRQRKSGTVINVASMAAFQPIPFMATYAATKAFVRSFTQAIAEENQPFGVRVMVLFPGATETNFFDAAKLGSGNKSAIGIRETQTPAEVVEATLKGLRGGRREVISGFKNFMAGRLTYLFPNAVITRTLAKQFRPNFT